MTDVVLVSLDDLALVLYLPEPTTEERDGQLFCVACGGPAGAHYCLPRHAARHRLAKIVKDGAA